MWTKSIQTQKERVLSTDAKDAEFRCLLGTAGAEAMSSDAPDEKWGAGHLKEPRGMPTLEEVV